MSLTSDTYTTRYLIFAPTTQVGEIHFKIDSIDRRKVRIVVPLANPLFAVFKYGDLIAALKNFSGQEEPETQLLNLALNELPNFLEQYALPAVDADADDIYALREKYSGVVPPLVVLLNGEIIGVLKAAKRDDASDVDWLDQIKMAEANGGGHPKNGGEPPTPSGQDESKGAVPGTMEPEKSAPLTPPRKINVRFLPEEQKDAPLQVGETYTLVFSVDLQQLAQAIAAADLDEKRFFPPNVDQVEIYVQLLGDDFEILTKPQSILVPRQGKSRTQAFFNLAPKKNGECKLTAVFSKDGNAVQAIEMELNVGDASKPAVVASETLGRPIDSAGAAQARGLTLWIDYIGEGFKVNVLDPQGATSFMIPLQREELQLYVSDARAVLNEIVNWRVNDKLVYQTGTDIPAAVNQATLPKLAEAGYLLFQNIFMHFGLDDTGRAFAARLCELAKSDALKIQIISKEMLLPWGMLYLTEIFDPNNINPELFLGLKHILEVAPMQPKMDFAHNIPSQPQLTVSLNVNQDIDAQMGYPLIQNQIKDWEKIAKQKKIQLVTRTQGAEVLDAFANAQTPDQITYFYCHAVSRALNEVDPKTNKRYTPDDSTLQFNAKQSVTLRDFRLRAPNRIRLNSAPLVFLNACESAELSPVLYYGFMPYFVDKGARGMIGTECPVPALFAAEWAGKFFEEFLKGRPLGEIFLELRREYFYAHRNILGLLYAVYCNADTRIEPGFVQDL